MKHNFCVLQGYIACWSNGPTRDQKEQFFISFKYAIHEKGLLAPIPEQRTSCSVLQRTGRYSKLLKVLDAFWLRNWFYSLDWKIICRFQPGLRTHHSLLEPYIINYYRWYRKKSIFLLLPGLNWVSFGWIESSAANIICTFVIVWNQVQFAISFPSQGIVPGYTWT